MLIFVHIVYVITISCPEGFSASADPNFQTVLDPYWLTGVFKGRSNFDFNNLYNTRINKHLKFKRN